MQVVHSIYSRHTCTAGYTHHSLCACMRKRCAALLLPVKGAKLADSSAYTMHASTRRAVVPFVPRPCMHGAMETNAHKCSHCRGEPPLWLRLHVRRQAAPTVALRGALHSLLRLVRWHDRYLCPLCLKRPRAPAFPFQAKRGALLSTSEGCGIAAAGCAKQGPKHLILLAPQSHALRASGLPGLPARKKQPALQASAQPVTASRLCPSQQAARHAAWGGPMAAMLWHE